ncbi:MAG: HK97 gp10 family phage protein [Enterococcus gallinarum]|uniref:HK97-gp10 family putative phage morphogenesis protein n=1 Tax=Enterococcus TaxID=1350 RepID=UPI0020903FBE|nr:MULTISPECIES: HK97-gp10 family putative phage morphogenesis protein [Enterococcus]MCI5684572.1 HK97 gp10 family phage protein [Enterococcus gallinarum]MCO5478482.1 HK97 gp10 family phage protein [Enterococcus gallinarum]MCO5533698.1 HK97 gp10 family phage protein [Enterococcus faecium]MDY4070998.1 HK97-gp10 family putative phage morphogenesis protein [Enterococcus gallinarum]
MSKSVKIQGLKEFMREVSRKGPTLDKAIDKEIKLSALRVERRAKKNAPWDTGWLSNNIYANNIGFLQAEVISPVEYSIFLEYGTRYMFAQPFLFPAVGADWPLLQKRLTKLVRG